MSVQIAKYSLQTMITCRCLKEIIIRKCFNFILLHETISNYIVSNMFVPNITNKNNITDHESQSFLHKYTSLKIKSMGTNRNESICNGTLLSRRRFKGVTNSGGSSVNPVQNTRLFGFFLPFE